MTTTPVTLSADQARRIALGAQGFAEAAPKGAVDRRHGRRVLDRVGLIQIDSVNVLVRSQELPLFARLGDHRRDLIPAMTKAGDLCEYWAHEASHVPVGLQPLLRWRMDVAREGRGTWKGVAAIRHEEPALVQSVLDQLVDEGRLLPAEVSGWKDRAYLHPGARRPNNPKGRALLSPFDSLVWERSRTERIWGFRYRIEIYVPKPKRVHGYYVLPFLLDGQLVARVDLKSDRQAGVLLVQGAFAEAVPDRPRVAEELAAELHDLAAFLRLDGVEVKPNGDLAPLLAAAAANGVEPPRPNRVT